MAVYLAHRIEETGAEQTMLDHLNGTASLAGAFGAAFGVQEQAHLIGQYHDIGKYSRDFQGYLASGGRRARVDHSTAGMQAFWGQHNIPAAFCVGGHHAGLPNLGEACRWREWQYALCKKESEKYSGLSGVYAGKPTSTRGGYIMD